MFATLAKGDYSTNVLIMQEDWGKFAGIAKRRKRISTNEANGANGMNVTGRVWLKLLISVCGISIWVT